MRRYRNEDTCPACGGKGLVFMDMDAHRSAGLIPCGFSTTRVVEDTSYVDLQCHHGKLTRLFSVPEPERTIMNANDRRMSRDRR